MPDMALFIYNQASVGAGQRATIPFQPGADEVFVVTGFQVLPESNLLIIAIRDSSGNQYISDQSGQGVPADFFNGTRFTAGAFNRFDPPIEVGPLGILYFDVQNTAASTALVRILLLGIRRKA